MSSRTYNLSLSHSMFRTFCFSCSCSCSYFSSFSCFISYSCLMNTSIHFAFPIIFLFHAYYIWHFIDLYRNTYTCTYPYHRHILIQCDAYVFTHHSFIMFPLRINFTQKLESFQLNLPNSSYGIYAKLVNLLILPEGQFAILIFQCLDYVFDKFLCTALNLRY